MPVTRRRALREGEVRLLDEHVAPVQKEGRHHRAEERFGELRHDGPRLGARSAHVDEVHERAGRLAFRLLPAYHERLAVRREGQGLDEAVVQRVAADRLVGLRVVHRHDAALPPGRDEAPVGASGHRVERPAAQARHDADRLGRAHQDREQVAPGRRRVLEAVPGPGQQERLIEPLAGEALGAQELGVRGRAASRASPRWEIATKPATTANINSIRGSGEQRPQPPVAPALVLGLELRLVAGRRQEVALQRVEVGVVVGRPVERGGKARAAVQAGPVERLRVPGVGAF